MGIEWFFKFWPDHEISEVFVSKSFFRVILHLGVSVSVSKFEIWVSQSCSLKFTILHSFLFPFSIFNSQVGIFYVWINCDTKHMFWLAENLLCKLYHWTSKKTQKICFHFKLFYKLKDKTKSFLLDYFHNCMLELSQEWDLEDVVSFSIICMLVSCEGFLCWSESLGCCLIFSLLIIARGKNPDIQISFVKFWKIK